MPITSIQAKQLFYKYLPKIQPQEVRDFQAVHTPAVTKMAKLLGQASNVDSKSMEIAGWLHDIGYINEMDNHAQSSLEILAEDNIEISETTRDCILNHGSSKKPKTEEGRLFQIADKLSVFDYNLIKTMITEEGIPLSKENIEFLEYLSKSATELLKKYRD